MKDFIQLISESSKVRIESVEFTISIDPNYVIIFMPSKLSDLEVVNLMKEEYIDKLKKVLYKETEIEFELSRSYKGAGLGFAPDKYSFLNFVEKKLK